jgi:electron transport complex protein RnfC
VYSPVSGTVTAIVDEFTPGGKKCKHVVIKNNDQRKSRYLPQMESKTPMDLLKRLAVSGIVDATLGGTPTYLRYSLSAIDKKFDLYVLCANCDPYLSANEALAYSRVGEVVTGAKYFAKILGSKRIYFIFTPRAKKTAKALKAFLRKNEPSLKWGIKYIPNSYPADNTNLLRAKFKPSKKLLVETDISSAFVEDAITCYTFFNAVDNNLPANYRVITVSGKNVKTPGNYVVKNGMSLKNVLSAVGAKEESDNFQVLSGGIMTGIAQYSLDVTTGPETTAITYLDGKEYWVEKESPCIHCGRCVEVCPMNLLPNKLDELCENHKNFDAQKCGIKSCIECGCCSYVCPAKRYLAQKIATTKKQIEGGEK